jgi:transposase, IS5 family
MYEKPIYKMQYSLFDLNSPNFSKWYIFKNYTNLGQIHSTINWKELAALVPSNPSKAGAPKWLPIEGYFGLMFLKHYLNISDSKLLERFNTDWAMQMFCGVYFIEGEMIRDNAFVSTVRSYLAQQVDMDKVQKVLIKNWLGDLREKQVVLTDATCYELYMRYPTDVKLLWESCCWLWDEKIIQLCESNKLPKPRNKWKEQYSKQMAYSKLRKKTHKRTRSRKRSLLHFLEEGIKIYQSLLNTTQAVDLSSVDAKIIKTLKLILFQQKQLYKKPDAKVADRIVSIDRPYVRPIVRGKENKPVEFGFKVHKIQVDGINMIEHVSYGAFNECKRLKISVLKAEKMFETTCTHLGADAIYATNENRKYLTKKGVQTNFKRKGAGKDDQQTKQIKQELNKERSTRLEGSFGNEKEHYQLRKIKARTPLTEKVWLYFGIHTANAVLVAKRRALKKKEALEAA